MPDWARAGSRNRATPPRASGLLRAPASDAAAWDHAFHQCQRSRSRAHMAVWTRPFHSLSMRIWRRGSREFRRAPVISRRSPVAIVLRHRGGAHWHQPPGEAPRRRRARRATICISSWGMRSWLLGPQVVDVERENPDLRWRQSLLPGGHMTSPSAMYGGNDGVEVPAIEPVRIRKVRGAHVRISLRILAMARRASRQENLPSRLDALDVFRRR